VLPTGSTASTLQLIDLEGNAEPFIALDQQLFRADAVWSPDGEQVAYITVDPADSGNPDYLAGQLWVASSNGQNPRRLVSDGLNMAPIWDAADPSRIYFTRYLTTTNSFRLFSTSAFSAQSEKPMVPASDVLIRYPFDRAHYWQPPTGANPNFSVSSTPTPSANPFEITFDMVIQTHIRRFVPLLGMPRWSPDGRYIATTQWQNGRIQPLLFNSNLQSLTAPSSSSEILAVPGDGWSASSNLLALIEHDGTRPLLTLYNMAEKRPIALEFTLDTRAGLDWHPINDQLLVTAYTDDAQPPSLHLIEANGSERALNPSDNQLFRADGVWSPDGTQIAYVADDVYSTTQDILAGNLWLADSVGNGPRLLVPDMLAVAPVWSPLGDFIFFTRFDDENGRFSLYRVPSDGSTLAQYIGAGTETAVLYPFDRNNLLQWSSDGKQLHFIGAGSRLPERYLDIMLTDSDLEQLRQAVPLVGTLQASPDGSEYAATVIQNGQFQVAYFLSDNSPPIMSPPSDDIIAFPTSGWSSDGSYLALLRHSAEDTRLAVLDTIQSDLSTKNLVIDTRAGLSWHPQRAQIMLTSPLEGITPTLQIHNMVDNTTEPFAPDDGQIVHGDGVWSPTGQLVAYIARDSITDTVDVLAGSLWIAEADGSNPQELVDEGHNLAPMWDFFNGRILFTRYMTETDNYDLYQVDLQGTTVERLGPSTPAMAQFPFDRQLFLRWSPDGRRWLLPGATAEPPLLLYQAAFDGTGVGLLAEQCEETRRPFVVRWTPTNRALLIACPTGDMFLHWLDSDRDNTPLTDEGLLPSWQP
jgi:Tol biopolymer transport system component